MPRAARDLMAVLTAALPSGALAIGVLAQSDQAEVAALHEFRAVFADESAETQAWLDAYDEHIQGADWYVIGTPEPTPEPTAEPDESLAPDPLADV